MNKVFSRYANAKVVFQCCKFVNFFLILILGVGQQYRFYQAKNYYLYFYL